MKKFRSMKAFKKFERQSPEKVSPVRILLLLKDAEKGMSRSDLVERLGADGERVDEAIFELLKEKVVTLEGEGEEGEYLVRGTD